MKEYRGLAGVPDFDCAEFAPKTSSCALLIPVINEGTRIAWELARAKAAAVAAVHQQRSGGGQVANRGGAAQRPAVQHNAAGRPQNGHVRQSRQTRAWRRHWAKPTPQV